MPNLVKIGVRADVICTHPHKGGLGAYIHSSLKNEDNVCAYTYFRDVCCGYSIQCMCMMCLNLHDVPIDT